MRSTLLRPTKPRWRTTKSDIESPVGGARCYPPVVVVVVVVVVWRRRRWELPWRLCYRSRRVFVVVVAVVVMTVVAAVVLVLLAVEFSVVFVVVWFDAVSASPPSPSRRQNLSQTFRRQIETF